VLEGALVFREPVPWTMVVAIAVVLGSVGAVLYAEAETQELLSLRQNNAK